MAFNVLCSYRLNNEIQATLSTFEAKLKLKENEIVKLKEHLSVKQQQQTGTANNNNPLKDIHSLREHLAASQTGD